jgi:hypothetical protein
MAYSSSEQSLVQEGNSPLPYGDLCVQNSMSLGLYHRKDHEDGCRKCFVLRNPLLEVHNFLHRFSAEVQIQIAQDSIVQNVCIDHVFGECFDPWSCENGTHEVTPQVTPNPCITSICPLLHHEGHKFFFRNNIFVFNQLGARLPRRSPSAAISPNPSSPLTVDQRWQALVRERAGRERDDRASRLLEYFDIPEWKGKGPEDVCYDKSYNDVDNYRYEIRHLVFRSGLGPTDPHQEWYWALKIDWTTLPHLETLYLDLRKYSEFIFKEHNWSIQDGMNDALSFLAHRMQVLHLRKLVIHGLCSGPGAWDNEEHKSFIEGLFEPAVAKDGKLEFVDVPVFGQVLF